MIWAQHFYTMNKEMWTLIADSDWRGSAHGERVGSVSSSTDDEEGKYDLYLEAFPPIDKDGEH